MKKSCDEFEMFSRVSHNFHVLSMVMMVVVVVDYDDALLIVV